MRAIFLIVIGILLVGAGITGLVHPQWVGSEKKVEVQFGAKQYEVATRRVTDIPMPFSGSIIVMGSCCTALGLILRARARKA
ncbi:MAG TPA: hypothetical protein VMB47_07070 [Candidatus Aquilonibacter sp.]|nr:hypothetical protein [Candidatus Aquilonibacter sp.]